MNASKVLLAVATLVNNEFINVQENMACRIKTGILFTNGKLPLIHSESVPTSADPDIFLRERGGRGGGCPTENALVLLYDTLISGFQLM